MKQLQLMKLTIHQAEFYAYHGVKNEERTLGGKYQVDLDLHYNAASAVLSDDVAEAVNYDEAMYIIDGVVNSEEPYNLIETLCYDILTAIVEKFTNIARATVRVRKYSVPIGHAIGYVEAEQTLSREPMT